MVGSKKCVTGHGTFVIGQEEEFRKMVSEKYPENELMLYPEHEDVEGGIQIEGYYHGEWSQDQFEEILKACTSYHFEFMEEGEYSKEWMYSKEEICSDRIFRVVTYDGEWGKCDVTKEDVKNELDAIKGVKIARNSILGLMETNGYVLGGLKFSITEDSERDFRMEGPGGLPYIGAYVEEVEMLKI